MKVRFNSGRALRLFRTLNDLWQKKEPIFREVVLSQNRWPIPEKNPRETANYLFFAALPMRGAMNSDDPFKMLWRLYKKHPDMFDPDMVAKDWSPEKITKAIREMSKEETSAADSQDNCKDEKPDSESGGTLGYKLDEHARHWHHNSLVLSRQWGGNLLNVYKYGVIDFEDAFRRIDNNLTQAGFVGMRRKIFSLLTIWLQEKEFIPVFPTPLPVDFHTLRILWATDSIIIPKISQPSVSLEKYYPSLKKHPAIRISEQFIDIITLWSQRFISKNGLSHLNINPAIWVLSRDFCQNQLQNKSRGSDSDKFVASEFFTPEILRENPGLWPKSYKDPCFHCPINEMCTGAVPSNPYYRKGLMVRLERIPYPLSPLPGMEDFLLFNGRRKSIFKKKSDPPV